jgi:predicted nucleotide-binding protein
MATPTDVERAKAGLRKLLRQGHVSPASVLACSELVGLARLSGLSDESGVAAATVAQALRVVIGSLADRDAIEVLFGLVPATEGLQMRYRRKEAAALLRIKPESFRVRREVEILDRVARALVAELANPRSAVGSRAGRLDSAGRVPKLFVGSSAETTNWISLLTESLDGKAAVSQWASMLGPSLPAMDAMEQALDGADFAAFIVPSDMADDGERLGRGRENVIFEVGFAMGALGRDRTFLLVPHSPEMSLPSDLAGVNVMFYGEGGDDPANVSRLADRMLEDMRALGPRERAQTSGGAEHGETQHVDLLADAALSFDASRASYADELRRAFQWGGRVPAKFQFATAEGGGFWLRLCRSIEYRYYQRAVDQLSGEIPSLAGLVRDTAGTGEVDLVSLGCGDGTKDNMIVRALASRLMGRERLYYYPVEVSQTLLVETLRRISRPGPDRSRLRTKAIIGDFTNLAALQGAFNERARSKLFSVLGNTLGSFDESEILRSLDAVMLPGDLVLIEANIGDPEESAELLTGDIAKAWSLSMLDSVGIRSDPAELGCEFAAGVSSVRGTRTVVSYANSIGGHPGSYKLSAVHHYEMEELARTAGRHLNVEWLARIPGDGVALLLGLRRT